MNYDVFICYSRKDFQIADQICNVLDKAGISYYIDRKMEIGSEFTERLAEAISSSKLFLFLVSSASTASFYVKCELHYAYKRMAHANILPYLIDGCRVPDGIDFMIAPLNQLNISQHPIEGTLLSHIKSLLGSATHIAPQQLHDDSDDAIDFADEAARLLALGRYDDAFANLTIAAESGHVPAQYMLATCYEHGHGAPRNMSLAARFYLRAAEAGHTEAQLRIGRMYFDGAYVPQDFGQAVCYYRLASEAGNPDAQVALARCYEEGRGVPQSIKRARQWYCAAAMQGHSIAVARLKRIK